MTSLPMEGQQIAAATMTSFFPTERGQQITTATSSQTWLYRLSTVTTQFFREVMSWAIFPICAVCYTSLPNNRYSAALYYSIFLCSMALCYRTKFCCSMTLRDVALRGSICLGYVALFYGTAFCDMALHGRIAALYSTKLYDSTLYYCGTTRCDIALCYSVCLCHIALFYGTKLYWCSTTPHSSTILHDTALHCSVCLCSICLCSMVLYYSPWLCKNLVKKFVVYNKNLVKKFMVYNKNLVKKFMVYNKNMFAKKTPNYENVFFAKKRLAPMFFSLISLICPDDVLALERRVATAKQPLDYTTAATANATIFDRDFLQQTGILPDFLQTTSGVSGNYMEPTSYLERATGSQPLSVPIGGPAEGDKVTVEVLGKVIRGSLRTPVLPPVERYAGNLMGPKDGWPESGRTLFLRGEAEGGGRYIEGVVVTKVTQDERWISGESCYLHYEYSDAPPDQEPADRPHEIWVIRKEPKEEIENVGDWLKYFDVVLDTARGENEWEDHYAKPEAKQILAREKTKGLSSGEYALSSATGLSSVAGLLSTNGGEAEGISFSDPDILFATNPDDELKTDEGSSKAVQGFLITKRETKKGGQVILHGKKCSLLRKVSGEGGPTSAKISIEGDAHPLTASAAGEKYHFVVRSNSWRDTRTDSGRLNFAISWGSIEYGASGFISQIQGQDGNDAPGDLVLEMTDEQLQKQREARSKSDPKSSPSTPKGVWGYVVMNSDGDRHMCWVSFGGTAAEVIPAQSHELWSPKEKSKGFDVRLRAGSWRDRRSDEARGVALGSELGRITDLTILKPGSEGVAEPGAILYSKTTAQESGWGFIVTGDMNEAGSVPGRECWLKIDTKVKLVTIHPLQAGEVSLEMLTKDRSKFYPSRIEPTDWWDVGRVDLTRIVGTIRRNDLSLEEIANGASRGDLVVQLTASEKNGLQSLVDAAFPSIALRVWGHIIGEGNHKVCRVVFRSVPSSEATADSAVVAAVHPVKTFNRLEDHVEQGKSGPFWMRLGWNDLNEDPQEVMAAAVSWRVDRDVDFWGRVTITNLENHSTRLSGEEQSALQAGDLLVSAEEAADGSRWGFQVTATRNTEDGAASSAVAGEECWLSAATGEDKDQFSTIHPLHDYARQLDPEQKVKAEDLNAKYPYHVKKGDWMHRRKGAESSIETVIDFSYELGTIPNLDFLTAAPVTEDTKEGTIFYAMPESQHKQQEGRTPANDWRQIAENKKQAIQEQVNIESELQANWEERRIIISNLENVSPNFNKENAQSKLTDVNTQIATLREAKQAADDGVKQMEEQEREMQKNDNNRELPDGFWGFMVTDSGGDGPFLVRECWLHIDREAYSVTVYPLKAEETSTVMRLTAEALASVYRWKIAPDHWRNVALVETDKILGLIQRGNGGIDFPVEGSQQAKGNLCLETSESAWRARSETGFAVWGHIVGKSNARTACRVIFRPQTTNSDDILAVVHPDSNPAAIATGPDSQSNFRPLLCLDKNSWKEHGDTAKLIDWRVNRDSLLGRVIEKNLSGENSGSIDDLKGGDLLVSSPVESQPEGEGERGHWGFLVTGDMRNGAVLGKECWISEVVKGRGLYSIYPVNEHAQRYRGAVRYEDLLKDYPHRKLKSGEWQDRRKGNFELLVDKQQKPLGWFTEGHTRAVLNKQLQNGDLLLDNDSEDASRNAFSWGFIATDVGNGEREEVRGEECGVSWSVERGRFEIHPLTGGSVRLSTIYRNSASMWYDVAGYEYYRPFFGTLGPVDQPLANGWLGDHGYITKTQGSKAAPLDGNKLQATIAAEDIGTLLWYRSTELPRTSAEVQAGLGGKKEWGVIITADHVEKTFADLEAIPPNCQIEVPSDGDAPRIVRPLLKRGSWKRSWHSPQYLAAGSWSDRRGDFTVKDETEAGNGMHLGSAPSRTLIPIGEAGPQPGDLLLAMTGEEVQKFQQKGLAPAVHAWGFIVDARKDSTVSGRGCWLNRRVNAPGPSYVYPLKEEEDSSQFDVETIKKWYNHKLADARTAEAPRPNELLGHISIKWTEAASPLDHKAKAIGDVNIGDLLLDLPGQSRGEQLQQLPKEVWGIIVVPKAAFEATRDVAYVDRLPTCRIVFDEAGVGVVTPVRYETITDDKAPGFWIARRQLKRLAAGSWMDRRQDRDSKANLGKLADTGAELGSLTIARGRDVATSGAAIIALPAMNDETLQRGDLLLALEGDQATKLTSLEEVAPESDGYWGFIVEETSPDNDDPSAVVSGRQCWVKRAQGDEAGLIKIHPFRTAGGTSDAAVAVSGVEMTVPQMKKIFQNRLRSRERMAKTKTDTSWGYVAWNQFAGGKALLSDADNVGVGNHLLLAMTADEVRQGLLSASPSHPLEVRGRVVPAKKADPPGEEAGAEATDKSNTDQPEQMCRVVFDRVNGPGVVYPVDIPDPKHNWMWVPREGESLKWRVTGWTDMRQFESLSNADGASSVTGVVVNSPETPFAAKLREGDVLFTREPSKSAGCWGLAIEKNDQGNLVGKQCWVNKAEPSVGAEKSQADDQEISILRVGSGDVPLEEDNVKGVYPFFASTAAGGPSMNDRPDPGAAPDWGSKLGSKKEMTELATQTPADLNSGDVLLSKEAKDQMNGRPPKVVNAFVVTQRLSNGDIVGYKCLLVPDGREGISIAALDGGDVQMSHTMDELQEKYSLNWQGAASMGSPNGRSYDSNEGFQKLLAEDGIVSSDGNGFVSTMDVGDLLLTQDASKKLQQLARGGGNPQGGAAVADSGGEGGEAGTLSFGPDSVSGFIVTGKRHTKKGGAQDAAVATDAVEGAAESSKEAESAYEIVGHQCKLYVDAKTGTMKIESEGIPVAHSAVELRREYPFCVSGAIPQSESKVAAIDPDAYNSALANPSEEDTYDADPLERGNPDRPGFARTMTLNSNAAGEVTVNAHAESGVESVAEDVCFGCALVAA